MILLLSEVNPTTTMRIVTTLIFSIYLALFTSSCGKMYENTDPYGYIKPVGVKPSWGPTMTPQMQKVIEKLDSLHLPPLYTLHPQAARQQPSMADVAMRVMNEYGITYSPMYMYTDTASKWIPADGRDIYIRTYTPRVGKAPYPVIVYYHGGNWVTGNIDHYHISARALSEQTESIVVSATYRQAPEDPLPAAYKDAFAVYKWIVNNTAVVKGNPAKIAVAGEGSGGHLAATVSIMARDSGISLPRHQVLIYPIADNDTGSVSYSQYAEAKPLNKPLLQWAFSLYGNKHPWAPLTNANLRGLPSTTIIAAEIDPLQTEGKRLADQLQMVAVPVTYRLFTGVTHDFFGMARILQEAKDAQKLAASQLINAFK